MLVGASLSQRAVALLEGLAGRSVGVEAEVVFAFEEVGKGEVVGRVDGGIEKLIDRRWLLLMLHGGRHGLSGETGRRGSWIRLVVSRTKWRGGRWVVSQ